MKVKLDNRRAVIVGCIYRPPSTSASQVNSDYDDIEEQLQTVISTHSSLRVILAGDLNSDVRTSPFAHSRLQELERYDLNCIVQQPTFYRGDTQSVLDVVLMSRDLYKDISPPACSVEVCDFTAHHRRVVITTTVARTISKPRYRTGRNWRALDCDSFLADVGCTEWGAVVRRDDPCDIQWERFSSEMNRILDVHVPVRRYRIHNPSPPPVTDETLELMCQRREAKNRGDIDSYKQLNKTVRQAIRRDTRDSVAQRVADASPSDMYRQLQPVIAPKRGPTTQPVNLTPDQLNKYFTSIGIETRDKVSAQFLQSGRNRLSVRLPRVNTGALNFVPVTLDQLKHTLFSMPNKAASAEDDIPLLKLAFSIIGRPLLRVINTSIVSETVPSSWKSAVVIPLHKKGDPSSASNFRPITLVPGICKIVEKLIHHQLTEYLKRHHLFSIDQHGFMEHHSTSTALLTVTDSILRGMDQSEITLLTLIDLSRCFDVVDHSALLTKLRLLNISTGWLESYLEGHTQCVRVGDTLSSPRHIGIGTFQGSCLGPLLFNVASNDLTCHIPSSIDGYRVTIARYADDTQIAITGPRDRLAGMRHSLETVLDVMCTWFLQHGMLINAAKTELLLCGDRRQLCQIKEAPAITFMGHTLSSSNRVKNLGVIMDSTLSWEKHVDHIIGLCFGILIGLQNAKYSLPRGLLPRIIDSLVFSHIRYCAQVYGSANQTTIGKLQKVFNFSARIISGRCKSDHISDVLKSLNWFNARQQIEFSDICLLHRVLRDGEPEALRTQLSYNRDNMTRTTRHSNHLTLPRPRTNHGKRAFMYRAVSLYNQHVIGNGIENLSVPALKKRVSKIFTANEE